MLKIQNLSLSLGVKQSHNPQLDISNLIRNNTSDGIIRNESNSNDNSYQPIKGIQLSSNRTHVNSNRNSIKKHIKLNSPPRTIILHKNNIMYNNIIYNATKTIQIWFKS